MSGRRRRNRRAGERRPTGFAVAAGWLLLLLGSLSVVTWRQARGVAMEGALRDLESERAVAEAERLAEVGRLEELRSRERVVRVARDRLGMIVPSDEDIVFVPIGADAPSQLAARQP